MDSLALHQVLYFGPDDRKRNNKQPRRPRGLTIRTTMLLDRSKRRDCLPLCALIANYESEGALSGLGPKHLLASQRAEVGATGATKRNDEERKE